MRKSKIPGTFTWPILIALCLLFIVHLLTLGRHPFVHSDEAWLASLTRAMMMEHSLASTEESFRLTPRYPHVLKTLYHLIQMPFLSVSWSAYAARLPSLIAGISALVLMVCIAGRLGVSAAPIAALFMALDPQFWYISHLGRQEMILIVLFLSSWYWKISGRRPSLVALPLVAGIFIHPNAFILALPMAAMFLWEIRRSLADAFIFFGILAIGAASAVALSFALDAQFLSHYASFGRSVGAGDSLMMKGLGLPAFIHKMAQRQAGTYYLPEARLFLYAGVLGWVGSAVRAFRIRRLSTVWPALAAPLAILVGLVVVGKYAPPTIAFLMPTSYLLLAYALSGPGRDNDSPLIRTLPLIASCLFCLVLAGVSFKEIRSSYRLPDYRDYNLFVSNSVGKEGRVLGNLNSIFALDYDRLAIWRDLESLPIGDETLDEFIRTNDIRWVLMPDELELIYSSRPVWNQMYGNPRWYPELVDLLADRGRVVDCGSFPGYAMRIVPYIPKREWGLTVYRIEE